MENNNSVLWSLEPYTEAKHAVLRKYLNTWLPILSRFNGKIVYIDGFSGPGEYSKGEDGSPIIAIKAILEHKFTFQTKINMLFIEIREDRCSFLKEKISSIRIPANINIHIICGEFRDVIGSVLKNNEENKKVLAPSFVFIDPFGFSGIPMDLIKKIMRNRSCEVLITFMYEDICRFLCLESNKTHLTETFGTNEWEKAPNNSPHNKLEFLHSLYKKQLESQSGADIKFVRSFKMKNKFNKVDYFLFFGTNRIEGLEKMKEAMWRVDKSGSFQFSDATYQPFQGVLFEGKPRYSELKKIILEKFKEKIISSRKLGDFIVVETSFLRSHYKTSILKPMEEMSPPQIEVSNRKRRGTYPDNAINNAIIKFL